MITNFLIMLLAVFVNPLDRANDWFRHERDDPSENGTNLPVFMTHGNDGTIWSRVVGCSDFDEKGCLYVYINKGDIPLPEDFIGYCISPNRLIFFAHIETYGEKWIAEKEGNQWKTEQVLP